MPEQLLLVAIAIPAQVDVYLAKFVEAMQALFDDNKHEAGQGHKELHIM